jgi:hypothetical protein
MDVATGAAKERVISLVNEFNLECFVLLETKNVLMFKFMAKKELS